MLSLFLSLLLAPSLLIETSAKLVAKSETCTTLSEGFEVIDDSPAINAAISACGNGGTIILPAGQIYSIRTQLDFTPCQNCEVQLEGRFLVAFEDWKYWNSLGSIIRVSNVTGATIRSRSGSGVIDANGIDYFYRERWSLSRSIENSGAHLFHITNSSTSINISNLSLINAPMRFFRADGNSSHLSFSHLNFTVREQWGGSPVAESETFGFEMGDVSDVSINDVTMDFRARTGTAPGGPPGGPVGICAGFEQGSTRISVRNMACVKAWGGALVMVGSSDNSGVYENAMRPNKVPLSTGRGVSDLRVSNLTFDGNWATGFKNALMTSPPEPITNVTWENVNVLSGDAAVGDRCYLRCHCITTWVYTCEASDWIEPFSNIRFEYFVGKLGQKPGPGWGCAQNQTLCDIAFEGWTPTISSREVR